MPRHFSAGGLFVEDRVSSLSRRRPPEPAGRVKSHRVVGPLMERGDSPAEIALRLARARPSNGIGRPVHQRRPWSQPARRGGRRSAGRATRQMPQAGGALLLRQRTRGRRARRATTTAGVTVPLEVELVILAQDRRISPAGAGPNSRRPIRPGNRAGCRGASGGCPRPICRKNSVPISAGFQSPTLAIQSWRAP